MLSLIISIISILITILFVVGTHEFAHFAVARLLGVKVLRFSIGFGKALWRHVGKSGTEYVLALIPLGGYVKMLDESEGEVSVAEKPFAYNRQPYYKKVLIVIAGPLMNLLCAAILYWVIFVIGFVTLKPIIGNIAPDSIAAQANLKAHQEIITVDGNRTYTWSGVILGLLRHAGNDDQVRLTTKDTQSQQITTATLNLNNWNLDGLNPDPLNSLGIKPYEPHIPLRIDAIVKNSPASQSPLKQGDLITALDGRAVNNWSAVMSIIMQNPDRTITFSVVRNGMTLSVPVHIGFQRDLLFQRTGYLGIGPIYQPPANLLQMVKYGPIEAISPAIKEIWQFTYFNFLIFGKMIVGKVSLQSLGGPVTIFETAGKALNFGFIAFFGFLAFLSVALGVINLLPIPGLDGGHILIQTIELIMRKPLPDRVIMLMYRLGFLLIFLLLFQAIMNDFSRLF